MTCGRNAAGGQIPAVLVNEEGWCTAPMVGNWWRGEETGVLGFNRWKGLAGVRLAAVVPCCGIDGYCSLVCWHCHLGIGGQLGMLQTAVSSSVAVVWGVPAALKTGAWLQSFPH